MRQEETMRLGSNTDRLIVGKWYFTFVVLFLLASFATEADAKSKDLCKSGELIQFEKNGGIYFRFDNFDTAVFRASRSCEIDGLCELTLLSDGPVKREVIWDRISVEDVCHAFEKSRKTYKNPYFGNDSSQLSIFPKMLFTAFSLRVPEGYLSLEIRTYYRTSLPSSWGMYEGSGGVGGAFTETQMTSETIVISRN
jgi:hypothetical protein